MYQQLVHVTFLAVLHAKLTIFILSKGVARPRPTQAWAWVMLIRAWIILFEIQLKLFLLTPGYSTYRLFCADYTLV